MKNNAKIAKSAIIETLESRIAPATVVGLTGNNEIFTFESDSPETVSAFTAVTGLLAGTSLQAMDYHGASGELYAIGITGAAMPFTGQLYRIDATNGAATAVGAAFSSDLSVGFGYGMDYSPIGGKMRVTNTADQNLRVDPLAGGPAVVDMPIGGTANAIALAYSNSYPGASSSTLYAIDFTSDDLITIGGFGGSPSANDGAPTTVGDLGIVNTNAIRTGFDIVTTTEGNVGMLLHLSGGQQRFSTVDLVTGAATLVGAVGNGNVAAVDIAVQPATGPDFADGKSFTYSDGDGDRVTVKTSKGTLTESQFRWLSNLDGTRHEMLGMGIVSDTTFSGADISITAKKTPGSDGRANVGFLSFTGLNLGKIKIGGNLELFAGGSGDAVIPAMKSFDALSFGRVSGGDVNGVVGAFINGGVGAFKIKGDVNGAKITMAKAGLVSVGGNVVGGEADQSGSVVVVGAAKTMTIGGSVIGGAGTASGLVGSGVGSGVLKVGGSIIGGSGNNSGVLSGQGKSIVIGGSIIGGDGATTGVVGFENSAIVKVGGSLIGGKGKLSGSIIGMTGGAKALAISGSVLGGSGEQSGTILASELGSLKVGGSVVGGGGVKSGGIFVFDSESIRIGGNVAAGAGTGMEAASLIFNTAKSVAIKGSLIGTPGHEPTLLINGVANPATAAESIALGSLAIGGSVTHGKILVGTATNNPNAATGAITIGGDFIASVIATGTAAGMDGKFGTDDDALVAADTLPDIKAAIGKIIIKGRAAGTLADGDHFGIIAEQLGSVSIGGTALPLAAGKDNIAHGTNGDFRIREI